MEEDSVICAIATSPGMGAIAVIRVSGEESVELCDSIFFSPSGKRLVDALPNTVLFGQIREGEELIDEVLATVFRSPRSFTGEDSVEISCHGSVYIQQRILQALIHAGARMARPGEYTRRAFLNGKMDLTQAEAVADLVASSSAAAHRMAMNQMRGGFSSELTKLREELLRLVALLELELDFSEEDVEFADRGELKEIAEKMVKVCGYNSVRFPVLMGPSIIPGRPHFYDEILQTLKEGRKIEMFIDNIRSFIDFRTAADLLLQLIDSPEAQKYPVVNIAGDQAFSKYEFALRIAEKHHLDPSGIVPVKMADSKVFTTHRATATVLDNSLLKKILGKDRIEICI